MHTCIHMHAYKDASIRPYMYTFTHTCACLFNFLWNHQLITRRATFHATCGVSAPQVLSVQHRRPPQTVVERRVNPVLNKATPGNNVVNHSQYLFIMTNDDQWISTMGLPSGTETQQTGKASMYIMYIVFWSFSQLETFILFSMSTVDYKRVSANTGISQNVLYLCICKYIFICDLIWYNLIRYIIV